MQTLLEICCGLDVHKDSVVACIMKDNSSDSTKNKDEVEIEIRTFSTLLSDLENLKNWIIENNCHHVAMESTGVYWYAVYETLETAYKEPDEQGRRALEDADGSTASESAVFAEQKFRDGDITLLVTNARHMRNVPGKKTDIKDAQWIASLLRAGLLNGSFIPGSEVRELRQLTRYRRNIVQDITQQKNRIEKTLQQAGFKLSTFLSDIFGVSGRNLINVLIKKGYISSIDIDVETRKLSPAKKEEMKFALNGRLSPHQRDFLQLELEHLDSLLAHQVKIEEAISQKSDSFNEAISLIDTIPGIAVSSATSIIAEIGVDMSKFETAERFCSWAGLAPGNNESAGKKNELA